MIDAGTLHLTEIQTSFSAAEFEFPGTGVAVKDDVFEKGEFRNFTKHFYLKAKNNVVKQTRRCNLELESSGGSTVNNSKYYIILQKKVLCVIFTTGDD